ncbi:MAG TPA: hypothetical protein VF813_02295 [Anaerolineaceae bacterium]
MARQGLITQLDAGTRPEKAYEAAEATLKQLGWEVYKKRTFAFLVEARMTTDEGYILANIIVKVFGNPEINLTIKSDTASQATVDAKAQQIMGTLEKNLGMQK